ncbi:MAG TPA: energy transducer TonB [Rhizomicrobium sp.]
MTMHLSSQAFDERTAHTLRALPRPEGEARNNAGALAITVVIHVGAILAFMLGVQVVRPFKAPPALMIHLEKPKQDKLDPAFTPPPLTRPTVITVPPPDVVLQPPPRVIQASPPAPAQAPPAIAAPVAQKGTGEGKENFVGRLLAQLNRFKQYPAAARKAHIEGVVMLHFVMDANGHVLQADIQKSSGRPVLDNEALALIQRAQPLPALPADYPTRTLDAVVPIEFYLDR